MFGEHERGRICRESLLAKELLFKVIRVSQDVPSSSDSAVCHTSRLTKPLSATCSRLKQKKVVSQSKFRFFNSHHNIGTVVTRVSSASISREGIDRRTYSNLALISLAAFPIVTCDRDQLFQYFEISSRNSPMKSTHVHIDITVSKVPIVGVRFSERSGSHFETVESIEEGRKRDRTRISMLSFRVTAVPA